MSVTNCRGTCRNGAACSFKGRYGGFCKRHYREPIECSVCQEETDDYFVLPCKHKYHKDCIHTWVSRGNHTCPLCRAPIELRTRLELGIKPDIRVDVVRTVETHILGGVMTDTLSLERRYRQCVDVLIKLMYIQIEIRNDVCAFLRRRMKNQRGLKEYNKILDEIKGIEKMMEELKNEIVEKIAAGQQVTNKMAVHVRDSLKLLKSLAIWENV